MKPDSSSDGRKKKKVNCMACICDLAMVEKVKPSDRLAMTNIAMPSDSKAKLPTNGTPKSSRAAIRMTAVWTMPMPR